MVWFKRKLSKQEYVEKEFSSIVSEATKVAFGIRLEPQEIIDLAYASSEEYKENSTKYINQLMSSSKEDLKVSEVLYEKQCYASAVYHIQQCIEKLTKAFCLSSGFIRMEELYGKRKPEKRWFIISKQNQTIDHRSPRGFVFLLKKKVMSKYLNLIKTQTKDNDIFKDIGGKIKNLEKQIGKQDKLARLETHQINSMIKVLESYIKNINSVDRQNLDSKMTTFRTGINVRLVKMKSILSEDEYNEISSKSLIIDIEALLENLNSVMYLYILSIITYPHFSYTRYPSRLNSSDLNPTNYNPTLGIVSSLPKFFEPIKKMINVFEKRFD